MYSFYTQNGETCFDAHFDCATIILYSIPNCHAAIRLGSVYFAHYPYVIVPEYPRLG
jgi:hypothetical protein